MSRFHDRIALISGGASGIGLETARRLAAEGARVVVADLSDTSGADLATEIGGTFATLDVTSEENWSMVVSDVVGRFGRVDVLVNCAGVVGDVVNGELDRMSFADWRRVMSVNLDGTFLGCREVLRPMMAAGRGAIVNLSSIASYYPTGQNAAYGASKGGVTQLTKTVALFGSRNGARVRCNSVHPGQILTPMLQTIRSERAQRDTPSTVSSVDRIPMGEGRPTDVASLIAYLASDEARYITGAEYLVDGGWRLLR